MENIEKSLKPTRAKPPEGHYVEHGDIPPSPNAPFDEKGHVRNSYLKRYENYKVKTGDMDIKQATRIFTHIISCDACRDRQKSLSGEFTSDKLPFDDN
ncbi:MAG: hypothetical protein AAB638_01355 [Patescibacteria group bacterium]